MGLLDQVIGGVLGSRNSAPAAGASSSMSPLTKALLMLLAAKAASHYMGGKGSVAAAPAPDTSGAHPSSGKIESGVLAGLPSLESILDKFRSHGHADKVDSWVGKGENKAIAPEELGKALGPEAIGQLEKETGMPRDRLMSELSHVFPQVLDKLTPDGRLPSADERRRWTAN